MRRTPLSFEEHRRLGRELHEMRRFAVSRLSVDLSNRYGATKRVSRLAHRLQADLDALRCELDSQLARDHPEDFDAHVYYPGAGTCAPRTEGALSRRAVKTGPGRSA